MKDVGELFGQRLKTLLDEHDEKQVDLARLLNVTEATVSRYLKGRIPDDVRTLVTIANHFEVTVDYLVGRTDDPRGQVLEGTARGTAAVTGDLSTSTQDELVVVFRGKRQKLSPEYQRLLIKMMEAEAEKNGGDGPSRA